MEHVWLGTDQFDVVPVAQYTWGQQTYCLDKNARSARKKGTMGNGEKGVTASKLGFAFLHFVVSPQVFHCMDLHCGGEPARVLLSGCPTVKGSTVEEKRRLELI